MVSNNICRGHALRIAVGITMLGLLLVGAVGAVPIEEWNKTFGGINFDSANSVQQTSDGGYVFAGETNSYGGSHWDAWLVKTDTNGNQQWNKTFGGLDNDSYPWSVQQTSDGGYILTGDSYGNNMFHSRIGVIYSRLLKTDAGGNEQWNKTFGGLDYLNEASSVQQTSDGGYILTGGRLLYGTNVNYGWLLKTDAGGNEQWNKTFGNSENQGGFGSVQQTSDGGYILAGGNSYGGGQLAWLVKTETNGIQQWNKTFSGLGNGSALSVQQTSDGGYILTGVTTSYFLKNVSYAWLIKTDTNGIEQWNRTFGGTSWDTSYSVQQTSDGGYILGVTLSNTNDIPNSSNAMLIKTDAMGNQQWNKTFGGESTDKVYSVRQTFEGGYILAGFTCSYGAGNCDAWLIKVSSEANATGPVHNINKGTNYTTIQAAINDATPGDEIHVYSGTYPGNVNVDRQLILRGIDNGGGRPTINNIVTCDPVILLAANGITIDGFIVRPSLSLCGGIYVISNNTNIINIDVSNSGTGITLVRSNNNTLRGNNVSISYYTGISLSESNNNTLVDNNVSTTQNGNNIALDRSNNNTLRGNNVSNSYYYTGIVLGWSDDNTVNNNNVSENGNYGISVSHSKNTKVYHNNFVDNSIQAFFEAYSGDEAIVWNSGYPSGGNYWKDYTGTDSNNGVNQDQPGSDGIGDTPYSIEGHLGGGTYGYEQDRYPLMGPYTGQPITTPTLTVLPPSGQQGTIFQYSGNNYTPNGAIVWHLVKPDGIEDVVSLTADSSGNLSYQYLSQCDSMVGSYTVWAIDATTGKKSNDVVQTILAPSSAILASSRTISASDTCTAFGITVVSPNGGENWQAGSQHNIEWTFTGSFGGFAKIELLKNGVVVETLPTFAVPIEGGSYPWTIPSTQTSGEYYQVRVNTTDDAYTDISNYFTVSSPTLSTLTVTSPNGGEIWESGKTQTIKWQHEWNGGSNVKIDLLKNGYVDQTITPSTSIGWLGSGSYDWNIPPAQTSGCYQIKITTTIFGITDTSDEDFIITTVAVKTPTSPVITSISSNSGVAGMAITINGKNFGTSLGTVFFRDTPANLLHPNNPFKWTDTQIVAQAPEGSGCVLVKVKTSKGAISNEVPFKYSDVPIVSQWRWPRDKAVWGLYNYLRYWKDGYGYHTGRDVWETTSTNIEGGTVFAAADGIVVAKCPNGKICKGFSDTTTNNGLYGVVIIAHRISPDGTLIYSMYGDMALGQYSPKPLSLANEVLCHLKPQCSQFF